MLPPSKASEMEMEELNNDEVDGCLVGGGTENAPQE